MKNHQNELLYVRRVFSFTLLAYMRRRFNSAAPSFALNAIIRECSEATVQLPDDRFKRETRSSKLEPSYHQKRVQLCLYDIEHFMTDL